MTATLAILTVLTPGRSRSESYGDRCAALDLGHDLPAAPSQTTVKPFATMSANAGPLGTLYGSIVIDLSSDFAGQCRAVVRLLEGVSRCSRMSITVSILS